MPWYKKLHWQMTFEAYRDHGRPELRLPAGFAKAPGQLAALAENGIDLNRTTRDLEDEGVQKFANFHGNAIVSIEKKASLLVSTS